jgi:hypothetical protein
VNLSKGSCMKTCLIAQAKQTFMRAITGAPLDVDLTRRLAGRGYHALEERKRRDRTVSRHGASLCVFLLYIALKRL